MSQTAGDEAFRVCSAFPLDESTDRGGPRPLSLVMDTVYVQSTAKENK